MFSSKQGGNDKEFDTGNSTDSSDCTDGSRSPSSSETTTPAGSNSCPYSLGCILKRVVAPVVVLIVATSLTVYFIGGNEALPPSLQGILPDLDLFRNEDPLDGEVYAWSSSGTSGGLELMLLNALDTEWHPFFDTAVEQWDNGSPDSLTLNTQVRSPDPDCTRLMGVMKVCNGDYGETGWKGVNEIVLQNERIVSSVAKMNEYFFGGSSDDAKRQYTMCHEIGHGFGLPHTDEHFWNRDQGNCMDYTNRPSNNMQPDTVNFETLASVYGVVGGPAPGAPSSSATEPVNPQTPPPQRERDNEEDDDEDDRQLRRRAVGEHRVGVAQNDFPASVQHRMREVDSVVHGGGSAGRRWRLLHESPHGRALEMDLGEGYRVQLHFLLA